jgi:2-phospho-L-lactate guanylyltransferase
MVIAPDRQQRGTNVLGLTLPTTLPFQFGTDSFVRYQETARTLGLTIHIYATPALALDIDTPDDLIHYQQMLIQKEKH